jgi:hypothetical protein
MYKVIHFFTDLHDGGHAYNVGDDFPREGVSVTEGRLAELAGCNNLQRKPLIEEVVEEPVEEVVEEVVEVKPAKKAKKKPADK